MSKCEICGGHKVHREEVEEVFYVNGRYVLVEHIPATVCLQCGEKTFDAAKAERSRCCFSFTVGLACQSTF